MKRLLSFSLCAVLLFSTTGCDVLNELASTMPSNLHLTEAEVSEGLKEALKVGIRNAALQTSQEDGYLGNSLIRIPFPEEAIRVKETLTNLGLNSLVDDFEESMNHAAEVASEKATDIFVDAITQMTITDAMGILNGEDDAATDYLKRSTENQLKAEFEPIINTALQNGNVTQFWGQITSRYNHIPFVTPVQTNLTEYVNDAAIDGLFIVVAQEEKKIRENPQARVNDLLKRVFGSLDQPAQF